MYQLIFKLEYFLCEYFLQCFNKEAEKLEGKLNYFGARVGRYFSNVLLKEIG
jgi:hypothetical protein